MNILITVLLFLRALYSAPLKIRSIPFPGYSENIIAWRQAILAPGCVERRAHRPEVADSNKLGVWHENARLRAPWGTLGQPRAFLD